MSELSEHPRLGVGNSHRKHDEIKWPMGIFQGQNSPFDLTLTVPMMLSSHIKLPYASYYEKHRWGVDWPLSYCWWHERLIITDTVTDSKPILWKLTSRIYNIETMACSVR
jgi:hypothetical protein